MKAWFSVFVWIYVCESTYAWTAHSYMYLPALKTGKLSQGIIKHLDPLVAGYRRGAVRDLKESTCIVKLRAWGVLASWFNKVSEL